MNDQILSTDHDYNGAEFKPLYSTRVAVTGGSSSHGRASGQARSADPAAILVEATVAFGRDPADGGCQLRADLVVNWPGVDTAAAAPLLEQAAALCPYAKMTR
ncbi:MULTISPECIES: hypothetical protein [unclassified Nonomuraea]|uniref:hypothetical protein n=1 Tax=unclassified Nonomuraea TaxID=2593643 RepID=UPI0033C7112C